MLFVLVDWDKINYTYTLTLFVILVIISFDLFQWRHGIHDFLGKVYRTINLVPRIFSLIDGEMEK